jgi:ribosome biogenesis protein MAK21
MIKNDRNHAQNSLFLSSSRTGVNRAHPYLPADNKDMEDHVDALYRVVHTAAPTACTQALMLLFHLAVGSKVEGEDEDEAQDQQKGDPDSASSSRKDRFYRALYATLSKSDLVTHGKHLTLYFNLLYKAMKFDTDANRVNAFAKRLMCTVLHCNPAPMAGSIFLLNEIAKTHEGLRICMEEPPTEADNLVALDESKRDPRSALVTKMGDDTTDGRSKRTLYPPCWELSLIANHFHPSVAMFAGNIGQISYAGDPLKDFGLAPFLDKFAYKNPKSQDKISGHFKRGESIAERRNGRDGMMKARLELPMNDPSHLQRESVNEQDEFFHKYFSERARRDEIKGITRGNKEAEREEEDLEDAEEGALDAAEEAEGLADAGKNVSSDDVSYILCLPFLFANLMSVMIPFYYQFEEYERAWESDAEEEAFVDSLALKLLEDSADGPVDLSDEDPDMDDWGDMYAEDDDDEKNVPEPDIEEVDDEIDDDEEEEESESYDEKENNVGLKDEDDFMDADDSDDSDSPDEGAILHTKKDEDKISSDEENDLVLLDDDDDDDDMESEEEEEPQSRKKARKMDSLPTFADADDYFEMINKGVANTAEGSGKKASGKKTKQDSGKKQRRT